MFSSVLCFYSRGKLTGFTHVTSSKRFMTLGESREHSGKNIYISIPIRIFLNNKVFTFLNVNVFYLEVAK